MRHFKAILLLTGVVLVIINLFSCHEDSDYDTDELENGNLILGIGEGLDTFPRHAYLGISTEKLYGSTGWGIVSTGYKIGKTYYINLHNIIKMEEAGLCILTSAGTYSGGGGDLGYIENGTYKLNINIRGKVNKGEMTVTDSTFEIHFDKPENLLYEPVIRRIPPDLIWGYLQADSTHISNVVEVFKKIEEFGAKPAFLAHGGYGGGTIEPPFKTNEKGVLELDKYHTGTGYYPVFYRYSGNINEIKQYIEDLEETYDVDFSIHFGISSYDW